jgi:hypothetical protein
MPGVGAAFTLTRDGDVWQLGHGDRRLRVRDSRGMELLARLVGRPGEEVHVLVLAGTPGALVPESSAGEALDDEAARSYRARLTEIDDERVRAEAGADLGRREALVHEREFLEAELARAFGLGGNARQVGSASERARVNVQRRLKEAITRIGALDPIIGGYLRAAIRTGTYCTFRP